VEKSGKKWVKVGDLMFRGINAVNLDLKGRLSIPVRYRGQLQEDACGKLIITIDTEERCLLLYPLPTWEEIERKISALSSFDQRTRRIQRLLIGHASEEELDGNGRILLPPLLREYASLQKEVILVGQGKKIEIWNSKTWQSGREEWMDGKLNNEDLPEELRSLSL